MKFIKSFFLSLQKNRQNKDEQQLEVDLPRYEEMGKSFAVAVTSFIKNQINDIEGSQKIKYAQLEREMVSFYMSHAMSRIEGFMKSNLLSKKSDYYKDRIFRRTRLTITGYFEAIYGMNEYNDSYLFYRKLTIPLILHANGVKQLPDSELNNILNNIFSLYSDRLKAIDITVNTNALVKAFMNSSHKNIESLVLGIFQ